MFYTDIKHLVLFILFIPVTSTLAWSQSNSDYVWEGRVSASKQLNDKWYGQGFVLFEQNAGIDQPDFIFMHKMESGIRLNRKFLNGTKGGGGFAYVGYDLFRPNVLNEYRLMEQYSFSFPVQKNRISSRIRIEQRIYDNAYRNRWRYRMSIDFPLSGDELNSKEPYFVVSDEVLYNFNAWNNTVENRLLMGFGWQLKPGREAQISLQYRLSKIGLSNQSHAIFVSTALFFSRI